MNGYLSFAFRVHNRKIITIILKNMGEILDTNDEQ